LLTLRLFSATGGIEKVGRLAGKALYENSVQQGRGQLAIWSLHDQTGDATSRYFPARIVRAFSNHRLRFVLELLLKGPGYRQIVLSHINLLWPACLVKMIAPRTRLVLIAHGIEVWQPSSRFSRYLINKCDLVFPVSNYTKSRLQQWSGLPDHKIKVLNNCLDPFLPAPGQTGKSSALANSLGIQPNDFVWMMLSRLAATEHHKGYDLVLRSISELRSTYPGIRYILAGKYSDAEKQRLDQLVQALDIIRQVIFTGYLSDEALADYFNIADAYIMPSKKEGFGITFIEALFYGLPVIAGNQDGSVDALGNGEFGLFVHPGSQQEIKEAMQQVMNNRAAFVPNRQDVIEKFGYDTYRQHLAELLADTRE